MTERKISTNCEYCGSVKMMFQDQSYCIFDCKNRTYVIMKDNPNNCEIIKTDDPIFNEILSQYKTTHKM